MSTLTLHSTTSRTTTLQLSDNERAVLETIRATPFGTVEVVVHQSKIVQVVKTERVRLDSPQ